MPVCPRCRTEIANQIKTWSMIGSPRKTGEQFKFRSEFFMCPECEKRFLNFLGKEKKEGNLKGAIEEIKGIERGLAQMMENLKEKIEKLKKERAELLEEIEELKRTGETKVSTLEEEILSLREEVESLKKMLVDDD